MDRAAGAARCASSLRRRGYDELCWVELCDLLGRDASDDRKGFHIACHERVGHDHCSSPDSHAGQDGTFRADPHVVLNDHGFSDPGFLVRS